MFKIQEKVRLQDTDAAGIIYFAAVFRWIHIAWEEFLSSIELNIVSILNQEDFLLPIVHAESDYLHPLVLGDLIEIDLKIEKISTSSFTINYSVYRMTKEKKILSCKAKIIHAIIDKNNKTPISIPLKLKKKIEAESQ